jgi:hypothetical protein
MDKQGKNRPSPWLYTPRSRSGPGEDISHFSVSGKEKEKKHPGGKSNAQ